MRLVDFLICLLEAHSQTLHRLAALFGDEMLLHMLEESGEKIEMQTPEPRIHARDLSPSQNTGFSSPYAELEGAVQDFKLPAVLQFHLWAYPPYRGFIEGDYELDNRFPPSRPELAEALIADAIEQAQTWVRALPIAEEYAPRAHTAAHVPWLKFRAQVLKRMGKRPLGAVT